MNLPDSVSQCVMDEGNGGNDVAIIRDSRRMDSEVSQCTVVVGDNDIKPASTLRSRSSYVLSKSSDWMDSDIVVLKVEVEVTSYDQLGVV